MADITDRFVIARRRMVEEQIKSRGVRDERVLAAMLRIPRHRFVEQALEDQAYGDYPLGIGEGQTISQPYIVALMTEVLQLNASDKVLEIGTGCGYQTSILASLAKQIYTIERIKSLGLKASNTLKSLGFRNIILRIGDGSTGWPDAAPFDAILIAAGSPDIPEPLVSQLAEGGRMVIPVGSESEQDLIRLTREGGRIKKENLGPCRFVRLVGQYGWHRQSHAGSKFVKRSLI